MPSEALKIGGHPCGTRANPEKQGEIPRAVVGSSYLPGAGLPGELSQKKLESLRLSNRRQAKRAPPLNSAAVVVARRALQR